MKKNIISLVAFLAVTGLCLSSCKKNNPDDPTPTPTPTADTAEMELVVAVDVSQNQYIDHSYKIDVNGTVKTFDLSKMTEITDLTKYADFTKLVDEKYASDFHKSASYKVYKYDLGTISIGQSVTGTQKTFTMKTERPSTAKFDVLDSYTFATKQQGPVGRITLNTVAGLKNTDEAISTFCETYSDDMDVTYTLK